MSNPSPHSDCLRWRTIPSFPRYEASNTGLIRNRETKHVMKPTISYGYETVGLYNGVKASSRRVHRLVLEAFKGEAPDGYVGCHFDGDKRNNHIDNLRWDTPTNNAADQKRLGKQAVGERHGRSKLTASKVAEIRAKFGMKLNTKRGLAREYGVTQTVIQDIIKRKIWTHLN